MRKFLVPAIIGISLVTSGIAMASTVAEGIVKSWNPATHTLTLDNNVSYILPASYMDKQQFPIDQKVAIHFDVKNGKNMATEVSLEKTK